MKNHAVNLVKQDSEKISSKFTDNFFSEMCTVDGVFNVFRVEERIVVRRKISDRFKLN